MKDLNKKNRRTPKQWFWTILAWIMIAVAVYSISAYYEDTIDSTIFIICLVIGIIGLLVLKQKGKDNVGTFSDDKSPRCPECHHIVRPGVKYCTWCGVKMPENQQITANNEEE